MRLSSQYEAKLMSRLGNQLSCSINIDIGVEHGADVQRTNRILQIKMYAVSLSFCCVEEQPRTHPVTHSVSVCVSALTGSKYMERLRFYGNFSHLQAWRGANAPHHSYCIPLLVMYFRKTLSTLMFTQNH